MNRAAFLRRLALGAGGLIVGEQALEAFARLTHVRKSFPSAAVPWNIVLDPPYGIMADQHARMYSVNLRFHRDAFLFASRPLSSPQWRGIARLLA
jgi:hypothetical protein